MESILPPSQMPVLVDPTIKSWDDAGEATWVTRCGVTQEKRHEVMRGGVVG